MAETFRFTLTDEEKRYLKDLVFDRIRAALEGRSDEEIPEPPTQKLREKLGAFVCLKIRGDLRGCIGHIVGDAPVYQTIGCMALSAAFEDPRFPPLSLREMPDVEVEISILSPLAPCPDPNLVEVGRHGLIVQQGSRQGLLLPQVPVEWGWDRENFLRHTCSKAGLAPDCWKSPTTRIYWFEAEVF